MKSLIILPILLIAALLSCKDENCDGILYSRNETYCADPWNEYPHESDAELENSVGRYLREHQIEVCNVAVNDSGFYSYCFSCLCTSGRLITVNSPREYKDALEEIGFQLVNYPAH
jgi:hypothetical protein